MPITPTYPGVYIEEIPSGVRTITGVATSITAFIGRARRGPVNEPVTINNFGDFERIFGGLWEKYLMSYAVRDFYLNGGSQALIVRLIHPNFATDGEREQAREAAEAVANATTGADVNAAKTAADTANKTIQDDPNKTPAEKRVAQAVFDAVNEAAGKPEPTVENVKKAAKDAVAEAVPGKARLRLATATANDPLTIEAASEGEWGNELRARVDYEDLDKVGDRFKPLTKDDLFNLTIRDMSTGATERFRNLTGKDSPRRVDRVLKNESNLARVQGMPPESRPKETDDQTPALNVDEMKVAPFSERDTKRSVGVADDDKASDGGNLDRNDITAGSGLQDNKRGLFALDKADLFNLLCIPPQNRGLTTPDEIVVYQDALSYCKDRRAMLIVDSPAE